MKLGKALLGFLIAGAIGVATVAVSFWLSQLPLAEQPATCLNSSCFCEQDLGSFPRQLVNSYSSLGFVLLGAFGLMAVLPSKGKSRSDSVLPWFAVSMLLIGASSFFYHSTLSFVGQFLDIFSMFLFTLLLTFGALYRSKRLSGCVTVVGFFCLAAVLGVLEYLFPESRRVLFALVLVVGIVLELLPSVTGHRVGSPRNWAIFGAIGLMVLAFLLWTADITNSWCDPTSWLQGHALWHVLTALAAGLIFWHYKLTGPEAQMPGIKIDKQAPN